MSRRRDSISMNILIKVLKDFESTLELSINLMKTAIYMTYIIGSKLEDIQFIT